LCLFFGAGVMGEVVFLGGECLGVKVMMCSISAAKDSEPTVKGMVSLRNRDGVDV